MLLSHLQEVQSGVVDCTFAPSEESFMSSQGFCGFPPGVSSHIRNTCRLLKLATLNHIIEVNLVSVNSLRVTPAINQGPAQAVFRSSLEVIRDRLHLST